MKAILRILFVGLVFSYVYSENCTEFKTCGRCIGNALQCVWCPDVNLKGPRCQSKSFKDRNKWCKGLIDPVSDFKVLKNTDFSNVGKDPIQLKPQKVSFKARPGESINLNIFYKPAKDYPLDIYFLMDSSHTMRFHMDTLVKEAKIIYRQLTKLTNNVRFGAGSFIEKFALPFANPEHHKAYSFINHLPLDTNVEKFVETVKKINASYTSGNYDDQEAIFDALMQAMVCDEINWRDAWKMIVVSTDAPYHSAGDGKFVGAYKPNDMQCHLTGNSLEPASLVYDYPSVSQINKVAQEKKIAIVFAVLENVKLTYDILKSRIKRSESVELNKKTENSEIVATIKEQYLKLKQNFVVKGLDVPPFIDLSMNPPCNQENYTCQVKHEEPFNLKAQLTIKSCPKELTSFRGSMHIGQALLADKVEVDYEILCECDCERRGERNSKTCSGKGTLGCGVCSCNSGSYGEKCECLGDSSIELDTEKCKANKGDTKVCSGRGDCLCGKCVNCKNDYFGTFCEKTPHNCPAPGEQACANNGECLVNGTCVCKTGWAGEDCTCPTDVYSCIGPYGTECNGHGTCECGSCICKGSSPTGHAYNGKFCNICGEECSRCNELGHYVECNYNKDKASCDKETTNVFNREVRKVNQTMMKHNEYRSAKTCSWVAEDGSTIFFKYFDERNNTLILIQNEKELAPVPNYLIAVLGAVGGVLFIGIVTLIVWKILVDMHDKREYRKFAEEARSNGFDVAENPIYRPPATNFQNPAYCN